MSLSLSILYIIFLILVGISLLFSFFNLYHLLRFGSPLVVTLGMSTLYVIGVIVLLGTSFVFLGTINWSVAIELLPTSGLGNVNSMLPGI